MQPNKNKRDITIAKRQAKERTLLLEKFRKMPIIQIALDQTGIGRSTYYRWRDEDLEFKQVADAAILEGETFITELSESKLLSLINKEYFPAVQLWLRQHHPKYGNRLEITAQVKNDDLPTPEEAQIIREALGINEDDQLIAKTNHA